MTRTLSLVAALALALLPGCTQGEGPVVDRAREVAAFSRVEAGAGVHVSLTIGPASSLRVRAQENIQDKVTTSVRDGTLRIEADEDFSTADPVEIEVSVPELSAISLSGGASMDVTGLQADAIEISLTGGAEATISGAASSLTLDASGRSVASLGDLESRTVTLRLAGGATAEVRAIDSVSGSASGGARLTVRGDASVQVDASGGADVHRG